LFNPGPVELAVVLEPADPALRAAVVAVRHHDVEIAIHIHVGELDVARETTRRPLRLCSTEWVESPWALDLIRFRERFGHAAN